MAAFRGSPVHFVMNWSISRVHIWGMKRIELLTGDHDLVAGSLAHHLGIDCRAPPENKIAAVKQYQAASNAWSR